MKKFVIAIFFILTFESMGYPSNLNLRRINQNVVEAKHIYNSTVKIVVLKSLSNWDINQAIQNEGRLILRGTIIHQ